MPFRTSESSFKTVTSPLRSSIGLLRFLSQTRVASQTNEPQTNLSNTSWAFSGLGLALSGLERILSGLGWSLLGLEQASGLGWTLSTLKMGLVRPGVAPSGLS